MPGQKIPESNPPPLPSHLPDHILDLEVHVQKKPLPDHVRASLSGFQRAACYIAAGNEPLLLLLQYLNAVDPG